MNRIRVRLVAILGLICWPGTAQDFTAPEMGSYEKLFGEIAYLSNRSPEVTVRADPRAALGLTEEEWVNLNTVSRAWTSEVTVLDNEIRAIVYDLRMTALAREISGANNNDDGLRGRLQALERQRSQASADHVDRLREALGTRFDSIRDYIRSRPGTAPFFPTGAKGAKR